MSWFDSVIAFLGKVLLPIATALLLEELTYGGLVRLLLALRPGDQKQVSHQQRQGGGKCSH